MPNEDMKEFNRLLSELQNSGAKPALVEGAMEVFAEISGNDGQTVGHPRHRHFRLNIPQTLREIGPLPREALFLGTDKFGYPVLLNLHNPAPGPLLIVADEGAGKTDFLKRAAEAIPYMHPREDVEALVFTRFPDEWDDSSFVGSDNCAGVFATYSNSAVDVISTTAGWAHSRNRNDTQSLVLFVDDLGSMTEMDFDVRQTFKWLLLQGAHKRVWPIITMTANTYLEHEWCLEHFNPEAIFFGHTTNMGCVSRLVGQKARRLNAENLYAGSQFKMLEGDDWLPFIIPQR